MTQLQLDHALIIRNTTAYNVIAAQREQAHGDIVGDGELSLMLDDLVALLERIGTKAEEVVNTLRAQVETSEDLPIVTESATDVQEFPPIIVYDKFGRAV